MKKQLTLKLIEVDEPMNSGSLIMDYHGELEVITKHYTGDSMDNFDLWVGDYTEGRAVKSINYKVVKPYGISDDEIQVGDTHIFETAGNYIFDFNNKHLLDNVVKRSNYKKVELLPEQFNYEDIVRLNLRDGDSFEVEEVYEEEAYEVCETSWIDDDNNGVDFFKCNSCGEITNYTAHPHYKTKYVISSNQDYLDEINSYSVYNYEDMKNAFTKGLTMGIDSIQEEVTITELFNKFIKEYKNK